MSLAKYTQTFQKNNLAISFLVFMITFAILSSCTPENETPATNNRPTSEDNEALVVTPIVTEITEKLDMREANVLGVTFERVNEQNYKFDVTLVHDDDGESPNFADAWQVEDLSGNILGVRILLHSHGNLPFTRSEIIPIPDDISIVIVRGRDMLHGHGGQSMEVNLIMGGVEAFVEGE
ncbi:MAG: hypothetical protein KAH97_08220 [Anaerolineales bacterium]|nr:hypothetical protein [Anaerolineales bacterium]